MKALNLVGQRFGRLVVTQRVGTDNHGNHQWSVLCDCGNTTVVAGRHLRNDATKSCGCWRRELPRTKAIILHGHAQSHDQSKKASSEYAAYTAAKQRCTNPKCKTFADYGGRGIEFRFGSFMDFLVEIGLKSSPKLELDRIDNDG